MEYKVNKITRRVWSWLNLNDANIIIDDNNIKDNNKINKDVDLNKNKEQEEKQKQKEKNKINKFIENEFEKIEYGLSKEILDLNKNNLDKYILLNNNFKFIEKEELQNIEKTEIEKNEIEKTKKKKINNIIFYPKSRAGAKKIKFQNYNNLLIDIHVEENNSETYILEFENIFNLVIRVKTDKESKLDLILIDREKKIEQKEFKLESLSVIAEESSNTNIIKVDLGEYDKYFNYTSDLKGEDSTVNISMAYVLSGKELYDMSFHQRHIEKNTYGDILIEGILKDESSKIFKGSLDFKKGSKGSIGNEYESITNYSKNTKSISLPILLAHEDEINGNHSANHGEFDEEQIYYIQSRGFTESEAKNIIAEAKIIPILDKVKNRELKNELKEDLKSKLKG